MDASTTDESSSGEDKKPKKARVLEKDVAVAEAPRILKNYQRKDVSRATVRNFFLPYVF